MRNRIQRPEYLDFLIRSKDKQIIKVLSGVRRCGKSTLFEMYRDYLLANHVNTSQVLYINFEDIEYEELTDYKRLYAYIKERLIPEMMNYIFLDEIQHVARFEKVVDSLFIQKNVDLYITGSNAYFMSGELATLLTGRYIELKMLPLSFKEYCDATENDLPLSRKYFSYIQYGSFPYILNYENNFKEVQDYLSGLYNSILLKDVVARYKISDVMMLESVSRFVFDSIGSQLSISKIAHTMTSAGRKIDQKTVEKYIRALMDSLLVYQAGRYNIKGKQHLKTLEKYYVVDIGLRYMLLGSRNTDVGHILENIVYLELLRRGCSVYVGQIGDLEVDFVAVNDKGTTYYQVAATVREKSTLDRELAPLQKIADHYPKIILTLDEDPDADYEGIKRTWVLDWLIRRL